MVATVEVVSCDQLLKGPLEVLVLILLNGSFGALVREFVPDKDLKFSGDHYLCDRGFLRTFGNELSLGETFWSDLVAIMFFTRACGIGEVEYRHHGDEFRGDRFFGNLWGFVFGKDDLAHGVVVLDYHC